MAPKVLFVVTSHSKLGDTGKPTGWYLVRHPSFHPPLTSSSHAPLSPTNQKLTPTTQPEFAHPYEVLKDHVSITVASPLGGEAPLDPSSVEAFKADKISTSFLTHHSDIYKNTHKLSEFLGKAGDYEAIFFVGGHGPMFDLATDETSHKLINEFYTHNKIIAAVCHGPAALTHVKLSSGGYLLDGQPVTGLSNQEEEQAGLTGAMPFSLEDKLNEASGGKFVKAEEAWGVKVVVARGGRLVTGQNPASATGVGEAIRDGIFGEETTRDEI
jgi:putative intracellular protease/amidase